MQHIGPSFWRLTRDVDYEGHEALREAVAAALAAAAVPEGLALAAWPVGAADLADPCGRNEALWRNVLAEGIEWGPSATLPPPCPHDRDAPSPWRHLPGPERYLVRGGRRIGWNLDAARDYGQAGLGTLDGNALRDLLYYPGEFAPVVHDLVRALLLAVGVAPPRTGAGRVREVRHHIGQTLGAGLTVTEALAIVARAEVADAAETLCRAELIKLLEEILRLADAVAAYAAARGSELLEWEAVVEHQAQLRADARHNKE